MSLEQNCSPRRWSLAAGGQVMLLLVAVAWLWADPLAESLLASANDLLFAADRGETFAVLQHQLVGWRLAGIGVFVVTLLATVIVEAKRFVRRDRKVSMRRLLATVGFVGVWCAVCLQAHNLTWQGKRWRAQQRLTALEKLATQLDEDWPAEDGEIEGLGPFTAYPFGKPQVLLLLTPYPLAGADTVVAAVEKGDDGQLRFQLGGADGGVWVEWHPEQSHPQSFTGGLADSHELSRTSRLGDQWYLVRYGS